MQKEEADYSQCHIVTKKNKDLAVATPTDLLLVSPNYSRSTNNNNILENEASRLTAGIGTDYNSGWMVGDIKGAWMSDVGIATMTADSELITNGTFSSDTSGWTAGDSTLSQSGGQMTITRSGGSGNTCYQDVTTVVGQKYMLSAKINSSGSRGDLRAHSASAWGGSLILNLSGTNGSTV